jgi:hypothetical protein
MTPLPVIPIFFVIPANAGIQLPGPNGAAENGRRSWIPAFAGMTEQNAMMEPGQA